jgi:GTP-binding protein HflX
MTQNSTAETPARTIVVTPHVKSMRGRGREAAVLRSPAARLDEAVGLPRASAVTGGGAAVTPGARARPATLIGVGAIDALKAMIAETEATLVVFDTHLTPIQQRNLEKALSSKVIDRTALILEIFGERARTREGALQVELAHLSYQRSRLVRSWTHLERQAAAWGSSVAPARPRSNSTAV